MKEKDTTPVAKRRRTFMLLMMAAAMLPLYIALSTSVGHRGGSAEAVADSFATNYFNWRFADCERFVTPASQQWLRFAASQVTQCDIDTLRAQPEGATVEVEVPDLSDDDTTATVDVAVTRYLRMDSIGHAPTPAGKGHYQLRMVRRQGEWRVVLDGMLKEVE